MQQKRLTTEINQAVGFYKLSSNTYMNSVFLWLTSTSIVQCNQSLSKNLKVSVISIRLPTVFSFQTQLKSCVQLSLLFDRT